MSIYERYEILSPVKQDIENAKDAIIGSFKSGGKLLLCGNGGSAADCEHIVGELMKGFLSKRRLSEELKQSMIKNAGYINK
ncbi:MAG: SIS domain-containing protein, partial [Clostridia bacterium]|nr:SIS domain-containing protein [Clostridia bacterium]